MDCRHILPTFFNLPLREATKHISTAVFTAGVYDAILGRLCVV